jgi:hypothetical protein
MIEGYIIEGELPACREKAFAHMARIKQLAAKKEEERVKIYLAMFLQSAKSAYRQRENFKGPNHRRWAGKSEDAEDILRANQTCVLILHLLFDEMSSFAPQEPKIKKTFQQCARVCEYAKLQYQKSDRTYREKILGSKPNERTLSAA